MWDNKLTKLLRKNYIILNIIAFVSAFACYFSMYAFRKPFTAAQFKGLKLWSVDFKIMLITAQVIGYTISKFYGIKFVSELNPNRRGLWIILFIFIAEVALILFGATPAPYNIIFMLINGLPLGMIWGLVFSYLEGRRTSEVLGCGMAVSFIVSSGAVKSVGKSLLEHGVSQFWMPAAVGAIFFIPLVLATLILESLPPPNEADIEARTERVVMTRKDRIKFLKHFWPGISLWVLFYMLLTAYRDFRDNFAPELWDAWGYHDTPGIFTTSEIIVAVVICVPIGLFMLIKSQIWTLISYHILIIGGLIMTLICTIITDHNKMPGVYFMIISGVGLYLGYVPFNSIIFDLLLATFKYSANSGFLMYISDATGYLSSVAILFVKNFAAPKLSWRSFFMTISYYLTIINCILMALALTYYVFRYRTFLKAEKEMLGNIAEQEKSLASKSKDENDEDIEGISEETTNQSGMAKDASIDVLPQSATD